MFRVNYYVQCTKGGNQDQNGLFPSLNWKDDNGYEAFEPPVIPDSHTGPPTSYVLIIKSLGGKPIEWQVTTEQGDTAVYEVYLALERIGPQGQ
jgi:hypothetical protein